MVIKLGLIIGLIAYFIYSGAGTNVMTGLKEIQPSCTAQLGRLSPQMGGAVCGAIGNSVNYIDRLSGSAGDAFRHLGGKVSSLWGGEDASGHGLATLGGFQSLASSADALEAKLKDGVSVNGPTADATDQMHNAVDEFLIGQQLMKNDNGGAGSAIPWLQKGAQVSGYGVMSQLSLGDIYSSGKAGEAINPSLATGYYMQALNSIDTLQASNTLQSKQMLDSLPGGSPDQLKQQIISTIAQLRHGAH